jgi:hydroxyethylthiazole kinase-like uncharacterized protein yjeF
VLVVGGSAEIPGAVVLAATAALRAGAGKLQIATVRSAAPGVAIAIPEARVGALAQTPGGEIAASAAASIARLAADQDAVVIGPGMRDGHSAARLLGGVARRLGGRAVLVVDAGALDLLVADPLALRGRRALITPHAGEMARLRGVPKGRILSDPQGEALRAAAAFRTVVVLKGRETWIAAPDGTCYRNRTGNVGLATSGSGDTLSGIVGGLAARGAAPVQAAVWGVFVHGRAGDRLARRVAPLGFLARELLAEVPVLLREQERRPR